MDRGDDDATVDRPTRPIPLRRDGVAVLDRPEPASILTVRVQKDGRTLSVRWFRGAPLPGLDRDDLTRQVARAPGDGDDTDTLAVLQQQYSEIPVRQGDVRVLWSGQTADGATVAAAVSTLAGGAHYVWGGTQAPDQKGQIRYFDGLVAADALDGTASTVRPASLAGRSRCSSPAPGRWR